MSSENTHAAPNLVQNGDFSQIDAHGVPAGWEILRPEGLPPVMEVAVDHDGPPPGGRALRIHGTAGDTGVVRLRQALPEVRPGGTYRLSAWIRHHGVQEPRRSIGLRLRWRGRVEEYAAKTAREGEWERWERAVRVADGADEVAVELMLQWTGGTTWFSDVRVEATQPARRPVRVASVYWR